MLPGIRKLERSLSRRAYDEVRRSEVLWREHGRRLRPKLFNRIARALGLLFLVAVLTGGAIGVPIAFSGICFHFKALTDNVTLAESSLFLELSPVNTNEFGLFCFTLMIQA